MRISDWSSDVCSSDLFQLRVGRVHDVRAVERDGQYRTVLSQGERLIIGCIHVGIPGSGEKYGSERGNAGLRATENQGVNIVRPFVGVDDFEVDQMAGDAELVGAAVAAQHVACGARDIPSLSA